MRRRRLLSGVLAGVAVLAACADDADDTAGTTTTVGTTSAPGDDASTTTTAAEDHLDDATDPVGPASTDTVEGGDFPRGGGDTALLVDVRVGGHETFDRVVLEFQGDTPPSYRVGYLEAPVRQDGSGNEVDVAGGAFIEVRASPAAGFDPLSEDARETYTGPERLPADEADVVREVVRIGDFEGQLAWVIGVDRRRPFAAAMFEDPLRLVVDVTHGPADSQDPAAALTNRCSFTEAGWEVAVPYPEGWVANDEVVTDTGTVPPCRIFDPDSAEPPRAHELTAFGFLVHVDAVAFDDVDGPSPDAELVAEEELTVDGRRAVRREDRLTEDGLRGPSGARVTTYTVDLDGSILVARTHEVGGLDYETNRAVLDAVMESLSLRQVDR